jgi:hypothetical protein
MNIIKSQKSTSADHNAKSRKLADLQKRKAAAWAAAGAAGEGLMSEGVNRKKWSKLVNQIRRLEESFVTYQGRDVDAETVNYMSGQIEISIRLCFEGEERLHRTADGTYYLYREDEKKGRHVHKLTLAAAVLWAVTRANTTGAGLRDDVNRVFRALKLNKEAA